jgi:hypothetical protein
LPGKRAKRETHEGFKYQIQNASDTNRFSSFDRLDSIA